MRKRYRIKPRIGVFLDAELISFLPTIMWQPWKYRHTGLYVVNIHWLVFHICFGIWERR